MTIDGVGKGVDAILSGASIRDTIKGKNIEEVVDEKEDGLEVVKADSDFDMSQKVLGFLRPRDEFSFLSKVPFKENDGDSVYTIVSAPRGKINWTDTKKLRTYSLDLPASLSYPIKLYTAESLDPKKRFIEGDKVQIKSSKREGEVTGFQDHSYAVVLDKGKETEEEISCASDELFLVDKDKTTRGYIVEGDSGFSFSLGYHSSHHEGYGEALVALYEKNRTAFNRLSRMVADHPEDFPIDIESIEYFQKVDKAVWDVNTVKFAQGYIGGMDE